MPDSSTMGRGGLFAANDTARASRFRFDYVMVVDPSASGPAVNHLRVTELMYEPTGGNNLEFVELVNTGNTPLNLDGVSFDGGDPFDAFTFSALTLDPDEHVVLVADTAAFQAEYGGAVRVMGEWTGGSLSNSGEKIVLRDDAGNIIHDFNYDTVAPWPVAPAGQGPSLEVIDTEGDYNDPANWRASAIVGGTPGAGVVLDTDGDGLSDTNEALAGTNPLNPDTDSDGSLDGAEVQAGTDPLDSSSIFRIIRLSRNPVTGFLTVIWSSVSGKSYTLEASSDMVNWVDASSGILATGSSTSQLDPGAAGQERRFYRARVE
jgi:hypothetical protein